MIFNTAIDCERMKAEAYFRRLVAQRKDIEVKERRGSGKRTLDQNALFHLWVSVIADELGYTDKEACKRDVKRTILGQKEDVNRGDPGRLPHLRDDCLRTRLLHGQDEGMGFHRSRDILALLWGSRL